MSDVETQAEQDSVDVEMKIIATKPGTIAGKGFVAPGSRHTILKSAFSKEWMVLDVLTAEGVMEIDPRHRYNVKLEDMEMSELKVLLAHVGIKTPKKMMKRVDVERVIMERLVEIAEDEE